MSLIETIHSTGERILCPKRDLPHGWRVSLTPAACRDQRPGSSLTLQQTFLFRRANSPRLLPPARRTMMLLHGRPPGNARVVMWSGAGSGGLRPRCSHDYPKSSGYFIWESRSCRFVRSLFSVNSRPEKNRRSRWPGCLRYRPRSDRR